MSLSGKEWIWPDDACNQALELACKLKIDPALARLLINRGIDDPFKARAFLSPEIGQFHSPWLMAGMESAVKRLVQALEDNESIVIYGDYDADGITAAVILVETLQQLGGKVDFFLPSRFDEGYGLHAEPLRQFREAGTSLVVTVDCGINAAEEIAYASEIGLDLIVTDHHQPLGSPAGVVAAINPLQQECPYPFKELSGAGIAFKLATALLEKAESPFPDHLLDLAALGTAADVVPLLGENRVMVHAGLNQLRSLKRTGFRALIEAVSLSRDRINSIALAYILAPAINAAGRMGEALPAAKLLLEKDFNKAEGLAAHLHQANQHRRTVEQKILREAEAALLDQLAGGVQGIVTLADKSWHHGVIGIVASRLAEKYNRPVALIALEEGEGRGSARSIPGFNITDALAGCAPLLERFGGHEQAAGFTIRTENIDRLRDSLNSKPLSAKGKSIPRSKMIIDAELSEADFTTGLTDALEQLEPFGTANPVPLFGSRSWQLQSWRLVGADNKHLKLTVSRGGRTLMPIFFSGAELVPQLEKGRPVDLAFELKNGFFRDEKTLEVQVKDLKLSDSFVEGSLEVIDRRGLKDRMGRLISILKNEGDKTALFAATAARAKIVAEKCPAAKPAAVITSGSNQGGNDNLHGRNTLILFDLPLYGDLLKPYFKQNLERGPLKVYLLYSHDDLQQNGLLLDHSLPTAGQLETIYAALLETVKDDGKFSIPGEASGSLGFNPASSFWERAAAILSESGLVNSGCLSPRGDLSAEGLPACLEKSPAYMTSKELREKCEQFQKDLLEGRPEEIASLFNNL